MMERHAKFLEVSTKLGETELTDSAQTLVEEFVSLLYGFGRLVDMKAIIYQQSEQRDKPFT